MPISWCDSVDGGVKGQPRLAAEVIPTGMKRTDLLRITEEAFSIELKRKRCDLYIQNILQSNQRNKQASIAEILLIPCPQKQIMYLADFKCDRRQQPCSKRTRITASLGLKLPNA